MNAGHRAGLPLAALLAALLASCTAVPRYGLGGAGRAAPTPLPRNPPDISRIPDATPRYEPRSVLGNPPFYEVDGHRYIVLASAAGYVERGAASWYGPQFHGLRTATGEPYDMFAMTAAHKTLPLPCYARVTNLANGRSVVVRINDRGPFVANRIIDLSYTAAAKLDMIRSGTAFVQVETLTPAAPPGVPVPVSTLAAAAATLGPSSVPALTSTESAALPAPDRPAPPDRPAAPLGGPAAPVPGSTAPPHDPLFIQIGAYSQAANARRTAQRLRAAGFAQVFMLAPDPHHALLRVRIGPLGNVQQFDALMTQLAAAGFSGARLAQD